jgi:hypothetical protein
VSTVCRASEFGIKKAEHAVKILSHLRASWDWPFTAVVALLGVLVIVWVWAYHNHTQEDADQRAKASVESLCASMCEAHRVVACVMLKDPTFNPKCAAVCILDGAGNEFRLVVHPDGGAP